MSLNTVEIEDLMEIKGVLFPAGLHFRQIIVSGPPGSGKTTLVKKLGGWPDEGYLDLAQKHWWRSPVLNLRPREVHLGLPFAGHAESLVVFEKIWLESPAPLDFERIQIPPAKRGIFSSDWRGKYAFDFQLPPADVLYALRETRAGRGSHPVDVDLTLEHVQRQVAVYEELALHLHRSGMKIYIRDTFEGKPRRIVELETAAG